MRLVKRKDGGGQWVFRYTIHGRRREMGLGSLLALSLKDARELAAEHRASVAKGLDPIDQRAKERGALMANRHVLRDVALDAFESRKADLKGDGKAGRWFSPLELHVLPKLGRKPVSDITQRDVRDMLEPIWHTKASTAQKAANRLSIVLKHAAALGLTVDLQVVDKAKALLGRQRHVTKNVPSMPWNKVPEFYASLEEPTLTHLALRLLILTGVRSTPLRFLLLEEIDGDVWTIPAAKMKGRVGAVTDFRVPLSDQALDVIEAALPHAREGFLFPSARKGVISDATMSRLMERRTLAARPHGFRSSIRTWLAECTDAPHEVAETVLAHQADNKIVRTYRQTDYLEQRKLLMQRWADHCSGQAGDVVSLASARG